MPPQVAFGVCSALILWLFAKDTRRRPGVSKAIYIPLVWAFIVGSRPLSTWPFMAAVGLGSSGVSADKVVEGSPLDSLIFLTLIISGVAIIRKRNVTFSELFRNNRALCCYFIYLGLSVLWADNLFVSFKRWIKDMGNVIMVLVVLSETDQVAAVKAFLARVAYLLLPLSVLAIKYYPDISRYYDEWTYQPRFCGMSTDKNLLGMSLFVGSISMVWLLLQYRDQPKGQRDKWEIIGYAITLLLGVWVLSIAQSATALSCTVLGSSVMIGLRIPFVKKRVERLGVFAVVIIAVVLILQVTLDLVSIFVGLMGRDLTFTGRTDIWSAVLKMDINPLFGVGFYSFWSEERMRQISEGYNGLINEAHNGYLETYLNSGLIGVALLLWMLAAAVKSIKRAVVAGDGFAGLRFSFVLACVVYAFSEAIYNRLSVLWLMLLLAAIDYPRKVQVESSESQPEPDVNPVAGNFGAPASASPGIS